MVIVPIFATALFIFPLKAGEDDQAPERIVFLGDSLTAGYGLDPGNAYPAVLEEMLRERGKAAKVINAGLSGDTSAGGLRRVDWILRKPVDTFVLALGANDALRGQPPEATKENLRGIIDKVRARQPRARILLAGMLAPPNMGEAYAEEFAGLYKALAREKGVERIPFLLEDVAGREALNLPDGIHPNVRGHKVIARNLLPFFLGLDKGNDGNVAPAQQGDGADEKSGHGKVAD
ncbi:MAG: arylesterase [Verrucomicrobia bacterium]|nr:arylesterase [Verrucomicrobiota bacterium]